MALDIAVLMDDITQINPYKDSSFAMLLEAQRRGHRCLILGQRELWLSGGTVHARVRPARLHDRTQDWVELGEAQQVRLSALDVLLMRKDPPVDEQYLYDTMLLELAEREGLLVVNRPQALRDANEKLFTAWFPELTPETLCARDPALLRAFVLEQRDAILKPMDGMGGRSIFRARADDANLNVIIETLAEGGQRLTMAQRYLPEIRDGDKRILMIDGEPVPYVLARIPGADDFRGNLARGGRGEAIPLSSSDRAIAEQVGPVLRERGMFFVGLDVIGDRLTEINVTSPTCIRELDRAFGLNIAGTLFDCIEARLTP